MRLPRRLALLLPLALLACSGSDEVLTIEEPSPSMTGWPSCFLTAADFESLT